MSESVFTPKINRTPVHAEDATGPSREDPFAKKLARLAQYGAVLLFGLIPVFFTPGVLASLGFDKALFALTVVAVIVITCGLLALRRRRIQTIAPWALGVYWVFVLAALVSGVLSGDTQDALRGSGFETQTVGFLALFGLVMSVPLILQGSKSMAIKALSFFAVTGALLLLYTAARVVLGAGVLSLGTFQSVTSTPLGGFNDLAIFAGLIVILGLITLLQLPLRAWLQYMVAALVVLSVVLLTVVNFFNVWLVVGFFALLVFVYLVSRDTLFRDPEEQTAHSNSGVLIPVTALVCIVSAVFIIAGDFAGSQVSSLTGVNHVEVRPSAEATVGITGAVYSENVLLGVGPNRFADAWRQYKDQSINETVFWDTDFSAGNSFVSTVFVNLGVLGGVMLVAFHGLLLYLGYRMLLRSGKPDPFWYYIGVVSFAGAVFLWSMAYIYVPGAALLLTTAFFTGLSFTAASSLLPSQVRSIALATNRRRGFVLMAAVIVCVVGSVAVLFSVGKQYVAQASFSEARLTAESVTAFEEAALNSFNLYPDDRFLSARAQIQLANINSLLGIAEPSQEQQQRFLNAAEQALTFAEQAVAADPTNPDHRALLASIYSSLAAAGIEGAEARAQSALNEAQTLDPLNPGYRLLAAQMSIRTGNTDQAREEIAAALELKRNYTAALYTLAQLDISQGNVATAIDTTEAIITLEPNNPTRYYQLGILLSADEQSEAALSAYQAAIALDRQYANARYLLALELINLNQTDAALEQLRVVQETNPENQELQALISQLEAGEDVSTPDLGLETPVAETEPEAGFEDAVISDGVLETDLVTPVNTVPETSEEETEAPADVSSRTESAGSTTTEETESTPDE